MKLVRNFFCFLEKDRIEGWFEKQLKEVKHVEKKGTLFDKYFEHDEASVFLVLIEVADFSVI